MRWKQVLAGVLCAAMLSGSAMAVSYGDTQGHWAEAAIDRWSTLGIVQGDDQGNFRPDDTITRAELAVLLNRYMRYTAKAENSFSDLPEDAWYTEAILCLAKAGLMQGDGEKQRPEDTVTRQEAAALFARAFGLQESSASLPYRDTGKIASWAKGYVAAMSAKGYLKGDDQGNFRPTDGLTRSQAVTILNNWNQIRAFGRFLPVKTDLPQIPYAAKDFTTLSNGRVSYAGDNYTARTGIDVSVHQGEIDWEQVAADGIDFAFIRLGNRWSVDGHIAIDTYALQNLAGAEAAGLDIGVYFFSMALNEEEAREEAQFVLDTLDGKKLQLPVVFDWEPVAGENSRSNNMDYSKLDDVAIAFCDAIREGGYEPMIYGNQNFFYNRFDLSRLKAYKLWFANYNSRNVPDLYYSFDYWQYSSTGRVKGISGNVDMNLMFVAK